MIQNEQNILAFFIYQFTFSPTNVYKVKKQEENLIEQFATINSLWITDVNIENFISNGAEQIVYLKNERKVLKINDTIYYASWEDYFNNLLLNNYFFPYTAYKFLGFYKKDKALHAVIEQNFVVAAEKTELTNVKLFLENSGFVNKKIMIIFILNWVSF